MRISIRWMWVIVAVLVTALFLVAGVKKLAHYCDAESGE